MCFTVMLQTLQIVGQQLTADQPNPRAGQPNVIPPTLSRVRGGSTEHTIRRAFPAVENGRQVQRVVIVHIRPSGKVTSETGPTFSATDPRGSILQAVFIETDRVELKQDSNAALLYWMETVPATGEMIARGAVVRGESNWSSPFDLSVTNRKRRTWKPHSEWLGDYMKGAFFFDGLASRFLAQWSESAPPNIDLHVNVVSLPK